MRPLAHNINGNHVTQTDVLLFGFVHKVAFMYFAKIDFWGSDKFAAIQRNLWSGLFYVGYVFQPIHHH